MPLLTAKAMDKVPNVVTVGGVMLAGIWWITNRREDVRRHEGVAHPNQDSKDREH